MSAKHKCFLFIAAVFVLAALAWRSASSPEQTKLTIIPPVEQQQPNTSAASPATVSTVKPEEGVSELEASLKSAMDKRDVASLDSKFREIEDALLSPNAAPAFVRDIGRMIRSSRVDRAIKLGLAQALIEGAGGVAIEELTRSFHECSDDEVKDLVRQRLSDLQGRARMEGRGTDLSKEIMKALQKEPKDSALMYPLAVALTKNPSAGSVRYFLDQVSGAASTYAELNAINDPRTDALVVALTENRMHSNEAVPLLEEELKASGTTEVRRWLATNALASIGSPEALAPLLESLRNQSEADPQATRVLLGRLVHPDAKQLMLQTLTQNFASEGIRQAVVEAAEALP